MLSFFLFVPQQFDLPQTQQKTEINLINQLINKEKPYKMFQDTVDPQNLSHSNF